MITEIEKVLKLAETYRKNIIKIYKYYKIKIPKSINDKNYIYFQKFYELLKKNNYFDKLFNMYEYLLAQEKIIYPAQLISKKAQEKFLNYLLNKEAKNKIKKSKEEIIAQEIEKTLLFLEKKNIKYKDLFVKKNDNVLCDGLIYIFTNKITKYLYSFDNDFIKLFEELPQDYQISYKKYYTLASEIREDLKNNFNDLYNLCLKLVSLLKGENNNEIK